MDLVPWSMHDGVILNNQILLEKEGLINSRLGGNEDFKHSHGWLARFKTRHGIRQIKPHGEAESAPLDTFPDARKGLQEIISKYRFDDVFNADETELFWRLLPDKTLSTTQRADKKSAKDRLTVIHCCNLSGTEKIRPLVIGRARTPRAFRHIKIADFPVDYTFNKKAWMTGVLFVSMLNAERWPKYSPPPRQCPRAC